MQHFENSLIKDPARIIGIAAALIWLATAKNDGHIGIGLYSIFFNGLFNGAPRVEVAASIARPDSHIRSTDCEGPCVLRYNYFPSISETTDDIPLFWMTPSHIFYIGDGENEFRF